MFPKRVGFLFKDGNPNRPAHIWTGEDTACRMYSTGNWNKDKYSYSLNSEGRPVCSNCIGALGHNPADELESASTQHRYLFD